jgi:L-2,4-diaminobutyric acid acetyltransferase
VGWVSAYVPPDEPQNLFIWQVAVAAAARGQSLAQRMIEALLARPELQRKTRLTTTVTLENKASWGLFEGVARRLGTKLAKTPHFERDAHFAGGHDTEWLATIGPLPGALPEIRMKDLKL